MFLGGPVEDQDLLSLIYTMRRKPRGFGADSGAVELVIHVFDPPVDYPFEGELFPLDIINEKLIFHLVMRFHCADLFADELPSIGPLVILPLRTMRPLE